MTNTTMPVISQSIIKAVLPQDTCPLSIKRRYIDGEQVPPSDLMMRGRLFEYHLIGSTRGGDTPELPKLKKGGLSQSEKDLMELITYARSIFDEIGLDVSKGQSQVELFDQMHELEGHIDHINFDIQNPDRQAIYDVKYTETKYDDRWNGWADFDSKLDAKIQACQYILLYHENYGKYVPYYFLVFGKSFWCRIIKVVVTKESMSYHTIRIQQTMERLKTWMANGWPASPEFMKCSTCHFNTTCKFVATRPTIETYQI